MRTEIVISQIPQVILHGMLLLKTDEVDKPGYLRNSSIENTDVRRSDGVGFSCCGHIADLLLEWYVGVSWAVRILTYAAKVKSQPKTSLGFEPTPG
ncbi:Protein of unknown function, partial [Cotesia congregata]